MGFHHLTSPKNKYRFNLNWIESIVSAFESIVNYDSFKVVHICIKDFNINLKQKQDEQNKNSSGTIITCISK